MKESRWSFWALAIYFMVFIVFIYGAMIVMAVLSFNGPQGSLSFPLKGTSFQWWQALWSEDVPGSKASQVRGPAARSIYLGLVVGAITSILALTLSMSFRRRFRGDGILFFLVLLALMTPGFLVSLGNVFFWNALDVLPSLWKTALGTNVVWALPFGFLIMMAVWNRYDDAIEESARDLGANATRTFREVTLPLVWTGLFGTFLFGFTLSWNEFDRVVLLIASGQTTLPIQIFAFTTQVTRPDLFALGTATIGVALLVVSIAVVFGAIRLRGRGRVAHETQVREELGEVTGTDDSPGLGARAK